MRLQPERAICHEPTLRGDDVPGRCLRASPVRWIALWAAMGALHGALGLPQPVMAAEPAAAASAASPVPAGDRVVYHVGDTETQALQALRNVRNHLDADPSAQITVVTLATGVDFLMEGAKDKSGAPYEGLVAALHNRGVRFEVCEITLKNRSLSRDRFLQEVDFVPSGVVRLVKLQIQGYAYIRP